MFDLQKLKESSNDRNDFVFKTVSGATTMEDVLKNGLRKLFKAAMPKQADDLCKVVLRLTEYTYGLSSYRRSYRSGYPVDYYDKLRYLASNINFDWDKFDLLTYLTMSDEQKKEQNYKNPNAWTTSYLIALKIDQKDKGVIDAVKEIILSDNNTRAVDHNLIRAVAMSHNAELHELIKNLLLAAKLQEGLRQAILETADDGVLDYFRLMIKTVLENDLLRYSSALRAVCVWMGLGNDFSDKRVLEKLLKLSSACLDDKTEREASIGSEDVIVMYAAMWAESVLSIDNLFKHIGRYMSGAKYQKLVGAYFLNETGSLESKIKLAGEALTSGETDMEETDMEVLVLLLQNYSLSLNNVTDGYTYWRNEEYNRTLNQNKYPACLKDKATRDRHFSRLAEIISEIPKDGHTLKGKPFDWCYYTLTRGAVYSTMMVLAAYDDDAEKLKALIRLFPLADSQYKCELLHFFIAKNISGENRSFLFDCLSDKIMPVRTLAAKLLKKIKLEDAETVKVEELFTLKTGEIRQVALEVIRNTGNDAVLSCAKRLIADKNDNKRLAALDLLSTLKKSGAVKAEKINELFDTMPKKTEAEAIIMDSLLGNDASQFSEENGFGLYDPGYFPSLPPVARETLYNLKAFRKIRVKEMTKLIDSLTALIEEHKDHEYKSIYRYGGADDCILGNSRYLHRVTEWNEEVPSKIEDYALGEVWGEWYEKNRDNLPALIKILYCHEVSQGNGSYGPKHESFVQNLLKEQFGEGIEEIGRKKVSNKYFSLLASIIDMLLSHKADRKDVFAFCFGILADFFLTAPEEDWSKPCFKERPGYSSSRALLADLKEVRFFLHQLKAEDVDEYKKKLALCYAIGKASASRYIVLNIDDIAYAASNGIVEEGELSRALMNKDGNRNLKVYTGALGKSAKLLTEKHPVLYECVQDVVKRVIQIELKRGDTKTPVSKLASSINRHEGARTFAEIIAALGKETLSRGYVWGGDYTKREVLSSLLKASCPAKDDNADTLKAALAGRVSEKRLLEAVMYAPAWIAIAEDYLGWAGLKCAAWYFHAHTRDSYSSEFETEVARFSPIDKDDFKRGAFDITWFKEAYETLGQERFEILYDCAKYISDGATHRRAQQFADAVLGKLKLDELEKQISDKRNKDLLMSYSLVPLASDKSGDKMRDALRRYEFINLFLKQSREFGAMRQASEKEAAGIAMENLARNLGYTDVLRFNWKMEMEKFDAIQAYFKPQTVGDMQLSLEMDESGLAELVIEKAGKRLKSVPAAIKKEPYVKEISDVKSSLKAQFTRARKSLEKAMENRDAFGFGEVSELMNHPVISPLIKKLVFRSGKALGFLSSGGLTGSDGKKTSLAKEAELTIAHPYDLFELKAWHDYQRYAFDNSLLQPFKQIFRELYTVNEDEKSERTVSRRYAGRQIQPKKTVALLKGRGWTVDYESGLQKVYYKENVIATMYALADWFSPSDIEAPTLETVNFYERKTHKPLEFIKLDPVLFSEVMRDVDLVVSVAHVGGVDPMASHSTMEMRSVIVTESVRLMKLQNVTIGDRHAKIQGSRGEYSVHLGSGLAHMMGRGALNILPVHSQHRGRLFLPFMDEDPKTAEIESKVLLLAEDTKIKDPTVMAQINA